MTRTNNLERLSVATLSIKVSNVRVRPEPAQIEPISDATTLYSCNKRLVDMTKIRFVTVYLNLT
jgi:hypothetical protein